MHPPPAIFSVALRGLCPRCGARTLFAGVIALAAGCARCGLDFTAFDVGDGPAAFLTLGVGALVTVLAVTVELAFEPPFWVHLLLWLPLAVVLVVTSLRLAKATLLALDYRHAAHDGRTGGGQP